MKRGFDLSLLDDVIFKIANGNKLERKYKEHELTGDFKGLTECHIKPDWILIYLIEQDILTLTLVNTGTHSDLFKK